MRRFEFVALWHIPVVFLYAMRRVACARCGVRVECVPWATGKHRMTDAYAWFLAGWAKRLSWQEVAVGYRTCEALEIALYHALGDLPEPELTHRFC